MEHGMGMADPGRVAEPADTPGGHGGKPAEGCLGGFMTGFRDFLLRGNVIDLAVAVVVGNAFTDLVSAVVSDWLTPALAILFNPDELFARLVFKVRGSVFPYGHFLNLLLTFVLVLIIVGFFVVMPMNTLMRTAFPSIKTRECPECLSEIPQRATRCKFCCAPVAPILPKRKLSSLPSKLLRQGSVPTPQPASGDKILARSQTLPASSLAAAVPTKGPPVTATPAGKVPVLHAALSSSMGMSSNKVAPLQSVPEDSCPIPAFLPGARLPSQPTGAAEEHAETPALHSATSGSTEPEAQDDSLANWAPTHPLFKSSSIHISALEASSQYGWLAETAAAGDAPTTSTAAAGDKPPSARGTPGHLIRSVSSKKRADPAHSSSSLSARRTPPATAAPEAMEVAPGPGMV